MVGHSNLGLADALRLEEKKGRLNYYGIRHEGAAAFACSGYAKLTGKAAACLTIAGPGATNLMTGLWDAKVDRAPVLALTGQVDAQVLSRQVAQVEGFPEQIQWHPLGDPHWVRSVASHRYFERATRFAPRVALDRPRKSWGQRAAIAVPSARARSDNLRQSFVA